MDNHIKNSNADRYVFFDKTADAKFQAFGVTLEEVFKNSQEAMMIIMYDLDELVEQINEDFDVQHRDIVLEGANLETLLYNFLEEIIFLMNAEFFIGIVDKIQIIKVDEIYKLKAKLRGTQAMNVESHGEIKAVTYNEMYVKFDEDKEKYVTQVVVDL